MTDKEKSDDFEAFFTIFNLILSTFAFAYIIASASTALAQVDEMASYVGETGVEEGDYGLAPNVRTDVSYSAVENAQLSCCIKLVNGASCQEGTSEGNEALCPSGWIPTRCNQVPECQIGCCVDNKAGVCSPQSPKNSCETNGGTWNDNTLCSINQCQKNCCVIGNNAYYVTEKECERMSKEKGFDKKYIPVNNENSCLLLAGLQRRGACTYDNGDERLCKFGTKEECNKIGGKFNEGLLCSNPILGTSCKKQEKTSCIEGLDGVYWIDSCENRENIWEGNTQAQKDNSWNNGRTKTSGQSCGVKNENGNINSQCGNCDRFSGSTCSVNNQGQAFCKSLNCNNAPATVGTKDRRNGETWCVYNSAIGDGNDIPGSEQYLYGCIEGEVRSVGCGDYRNGLCNEEIINGDIGNFSQARCRPNMALECLKYNGEKNPAKKVNLCQENPDCKVERMDFGKGYEFTLCLPEYPRGFDTTTKDGRKKAGSFCAQANFECTKIETKGFGGWKCVAGCDCDSQKYTDQMTEWCTSLGDCGPSANTQGKLTTEGFKTNGKLLTTQGINQLKSYSEPRKDKFIEATDYTQKLLEEYYGSAETSTTTQGVAGATGAWFGQLGQGVSAVGLLASGANYLEIGATYNFAVVEGEAAGEAGLALVPEATPNPLISAIGTAAMGFGIGTAVGSLLAQAFGIEGQGALIMSITGGIAGAVVGYAVSGIASGAATVGSTAAAGGFAGGLAGTVQSVASAVGVTIGGSSGALIAAAIILFWVIIVLIVIAIILSIFGIGDTKEETYIYTCKSWQAPSGGNDCGKCDDDPLKPCTKYVCSTLGKACEYINEGTNHPSCVNVVENDNKAPTISQWSEGLTPGYKLEVIDNYKAKLLTNTSECVPEFAGVNVGIMTDEVSQCVFSDKPISTIEEGREYLSGDTSFETNHSLQVWIPSAESVIYELANETELAAINLTLLEQQINSQYNNINYYIKCQDRNGNSDIKNYVINTCIKPSNDIIPPTITKAVPRNGIITALNQTEINLTIYTDEPATCKWSETAGKNYTLMENTMKCNNKLRELTQFGWACKTALTNIKGEKEYYIKCQDKPWLISTSKESERIAHDQDVVYTINSTKTALRITTITPRNTTIIGNNEPFDITIKAETNGGSDEGSAECKYSFKKEQGYNLMYNTYSTKHQQRLNLLRRGNHTLFIKCEDKAGNIAEGQTTFTLEFDSIPPLVTRAFNNGGSLTITTNEESKCYYTKTSCNYAIENATQMTGEQLVHNGEWKTGETYYVRCLDKYNNPRTNNACSIIVRSYGTLKE